MKEKELFYTIKCGKGIEYYAYFKCIWDMSFPQNGTKMTYFYNLEDYRDRNKEHTISFNKLEKIINKEEPIYSDYMGYKED